MRHLALTVTIAGLAAGLVACSKPQPAAPVSGAQAGASPTGDEPGDADSKALLARLPAPYNTADLDNGAAKFALCASCHTAREGAPAMTGPNLHGLFGRKAGGVAGFKYSDDMKAANWTWDAARMDAWITDPKAVLPNTKMTFIGLKDPKDRADIIAYLMIETGFKP